MRKLERIEDGKIIAGVCAGLGEHFNIDAVVFRMIFVAGSLLWGTGFILYFVLRSIMSVRKGLKDENDQTH